MRLNNKGFSLLEIMAVLAISTILIVPLLTGLSDAYNANKRAQFRSNALSVAEGSVNALAKIDFSDFRTLLNESHSSTDYVELNELNCSNIDDDTNESICTNIFTQVWNNQEFDETTFKIYLIDYKLTTDQYNNITSSDIPDEVITAIENNTDITEHLDEANVDTLIRVVIWIQYFNEPAKAITMEGMLVNE